MTLYYYCKSCKKLNSFKTSATNRFELQQERGNEISERCRRCGTTTTRRINRVHARVNPIYPLAVIFLCFLALATYVVVSLVINGVLYIPVKLFLGALILAPIALWTYYERRASAFNKVMVSDG